MNKDYTHIIVILDQSGSMESVREDTIGGFNQFIKDQQSKPGKATLTLVKFSHNYATEIDMQPIAGVKALTANTYKPDGYTALNDAVCKAIDCDGNKLSNMSEAERPGLVICVILTDGEENSSKEFTFNDVKDRVTQQTEKYNWQFIFIGANIDAFAVGNQFGITHGNTIQYTANNKGTKKIYASMSANVAAYRSMSATGQSLKDKDFFNNQDRDAQAKA